METITTLSEADRAFLLQLYQEHYGLVRQSILQVIGQNDALEDLINDAFLRLIDNLTLLRSLNSYKLNTYIARTGRHVAINFLRDRERQQRHTTSLATEEVAAAADKAQVEDRIISQEEFAHLKVTIQRLPQKLRDVLYGKYLLGQSDDELARQLAITPGSVRQYLTRARRALLQLIQEEVGQDEQE